MNTSSMSAHGMGRFFTCLLAIVALQSGVVAARAQAVTLGATSLTFSQAAQSTSSAQIVTVTNSGTSNLIVSGVTVTGSDTWNFPETTTCSPSPLAPGHYCTVSVKFNPNLAKTFSATVDIVSNAPGSPATISLSGTGTGALSIDTSNPTGWVISNGALTLKWDSTSLTANVWSVILAGTTTELVDTTVTQSDGNPYGLYEDDTFTLGSGGTVTTGYSQVGNEYIDWWQTTASNPSNGDAFTVSRHFIITANDPGFHVYNTTDHASTDITGSIGTLGKTFRINQTAFTNSYSVNAGLNNLGVEDIALPSPTVEHAAGLDSGRAVQNAVVDLHGETLPSGFGREFETKYDYATQAYLHQEHGLYGATYGAWEVLPNGEWRAGGPTKQSLCFTYNILSQEFYTTHLDNGLNYTIDSGTAFNRLWGPNYYHFNQFNATLTTPALLYADAQTYLPVLNTLYNDDATLIGSGYVASNRRGKVAPAITGGGSSTLYSAWTVLSDPATNFQYSTYGRDYWVNQNSTGTTEMPGVVPGTYRLSSYVLGQWGEMRKDSVVVNYNSTTNVSGTFTPENFSGSNPIWTIGTSDRSAHEFLHGGVSASGTGSDNRQYWGNWNYWSDFAAGNGAAVYYATAVGSTPATNNLYKWNLVQWGQFDPNLYGGVYNSTDDTTDGYTYIVPAYVAGLSNASGINGVTTSVPPWQVYFTTTNSQLTQGTYADLSVGLAAVEASLTVSLNGHSLVWHSINPSDAMVRSGLSGYYQWIVFEWPTSYLNAAGASNELTFSVSQGDGVMYDALRMEISSTGANPSTTNWHDYEYVTSGTYVAANDAVPNN